MGDFSRQFKLAGEEGNRRLAEAKVAVFGIGGVGGYVAEALARAAVGAIKLIDFDNVDKTNINRQLIALESTVGMPKVEVMRERILDINPLCNVDTVKIRVSYDNAAELLEGVTYAVDAVDNVPAKLAIIKACGEMGIHCVSSMGAGNRIKGTFRVMDIYDTKDDALAKAVRSGLRKIGVLTQKVVCCDTPSQIKMEQGQPISSISYMPGLCGLTIAAEVIRDITGVLL